MPEIADANRANWGEALVAALDWWRDAGVEGTFVDDPQDWLAQGEHSAEAPVPAPQKPLRELVATRDSPQAPIVSDRSRWPQSLDEFASWWLAEGPLAPAGLARLPPAGPVQARLMVLVPMPSADDGDALLSGRAGRLLDAMLGSMGLARAETYIASALPAHVPMPDWEALRATGLGEVLLHHIRLAAPQKLLVLGATGVSALLGHDPPNLAHGLRTINQETSGIAAISTWDLDAMLVRPSLKAGFWGRWLDWTGK